MISSVKSRCQSNIGLGDGESPPGVCMVSSRSGLTALE